MIQLLRLEVSHLAAIGHVAIDFGPGLNVLYGPNDLGKSTVAQSIRMALLLPHTSSYSANFLPWGRDGDPVVELTFTTGPQRIHRVRKQFGRANSSRLQESRNGREFEDAETGRAVDGALRRLLAWGIPEPGGAERTHGLPESFLATALLSTQQDVGAVLGRDLKDDRTGTGKEQIAKALETIAQNPQFLALLQQTQERRDAAYTENGRKRTGQGSVFKEAADRVNEAREEVERWRTVVSDAEGAVAKLRRLGEQRDGVHERLARGKAELDTLEKLAEQTARRAAAQNLVLAAEEELKRIRNLGRDVEAGEHNLTLLASEVAERTLVYEEAKKQQRGAQAAVAAAQATIQAEGAGSSAADVRALARKAEIAEAMRAMEPRAAGLRHARALAQAALEKDRELRAHEAGAVHANRALAEAREREHAAHARLAHCGLLDKMLAARAADRELQITREQVDRRAELEKAQTTAAIERDRLVLERAAIVVPPAPLLAPMRKLAQELARARGALEVGIVTTIVPYRAVEFTVRKDTVPSETFSTADPQVLEARAELELTFAGVATVLVTGGSREVQQRAVAIEAEWNSDVSPHLQAAGVADFEALEGKIVAAQLLDASLRTHEQTLAALQPQIDSLKNAASALEQAEQAAAACRAALGDANQAELRAELVSLGSQAAANIRTRREQSGIELEAARTQCSKRAEAGAVAEDRVRQLRQQLEAAVSQRDEAAARYPQGLEAALATAEADHATLKREEQTIAAEQTARAAGASQKARQFQADLRQAQEQGKTAATAEDDANRQRERALAAHAYEEGNLRALRKQRDAANLPLAEDNLQRAATQLQLLPVPERTLTEAEVGAARATVNRLESELNTLKSDIDRAHGALEQTGGTVARERLTEAEEAWHIAEQREREIEAEFEAWKLLLEQMKEADAAQASNLGLALTPAVADRFTELTRTRYGPVKLSAGLATEGIVAGGTERPTSLLSVGTRDQLSTLFRLAIAEHLQATVVLDDQLVQSDELRMQWFRALLYEKARQFQMIVLTCRPEDYLPAAAMAPESTAPYVDLEGHLVRAMDLGRALRRHT